MIIFAVVFCHTAGADPGFDQGGGAPDRDRPKTAILGPQFCRILVLGPHFWWSGGGGRAPGAPHWIRPCTVMKLLSLMLAMLIAFQNVLAGMFFFASITHDI